ncbi:Zinc finger, PHD-type,Zinc finger, FYVE/PHD-type,CpG binding protein, C-terminal,Zinc finger [Cinara cedri]|uniref:CXXC-type zinc finger protein 1 n=1 Tax=Cinara cedri TaxID=506608 RepID=A0A5E4MBA2_9HEMI|nr:Zinc finger, PHD-type,Zinc finger, FYVE/PHD-type,CpG binding protein, C-terminal,Zinc finger [Cinara cedri]
MSRLSKEEIARQFMLPERKSKIATLLKQDGQAYCICRSSDCSRFMIGCDSCEDWYHGDCIGITRKQSKLIKHYFCDKCKAEDSSLKTVFKTSMSRSDFKEKIDQYVEIKRDNRSKHRPKHRFCGRCENCERVEDCGLCFGCSEMRKFGGVDLCENRKCLNLNNIQENRSLCKSTKKKRKDSSSEGDHANLPLLNRRQCYGLECTQIARFNSKYCSDKCGMSLAGARIFSVLPQRIHEWMMRPSIAEKSNKKNLEAVRKEQLEVRDILKELDKRHKELDQLLEKSKLLTVDLNQEIQDIDEEMSMHCVTCGHEIHTRTAVKHMEKCFNKYESQSSFGSIYQTRIDGNNMFCDFYSPSQGTYCKRLRVLCPEHFKDSTVISDTEVCGCPLVSNVFNLTGEFCRVSKKTCIKHYCWDKLRRAEIDMERVRQWLKLDELVEKERQIRNRMSTRGGVLALMLHSTYNHDMMEQLAKDQLAKEQLAKKQLAKEQLASKSETIS